MTPASDTLLAETFPPVSAMPEPTPPAGIRSRVDATVMTLFAMIHCQLFGKRYRRTPAAADFDG